MDKESFIVHTDTWPAIMTLSMEQRGVLFTGLVCHQLGEELPKMDVQTQMAYMFMAAQMDRDSEKYQSIAEKRRQAANARWQKKSSGEGVYDMQMHVLHYDTDTDTDTDTVTDNDTETDTEARERPDGLSSEDRDLLDQELGHDKVETLLEEVRLWAVNNGRKITDLPGMIRQFARNQDRWGNMNRRGGSAIARAFKKLDEEYGTT